MSRSLGSKRKRRIAAKRTDAWILTRNNLITHAIFSFLSNKSTAGWTGLPSKAGVVKRTTEQNILAHFHYLGKSRNRPYFRIFSVTQNSPK